jgi:hypothetical protein
MRDLDIIESELRLLALVRRTAAEVGAPAPRIGPVDQLLDEWNDALARWVRSIAVRPLRW